MTPEVVHLVPHTHWDREWYLPWQRFRMRLVELVDGLLDAMAADERVRFTLDGQTATVDDYLEIRPERENELRRLVADGRLAVGPWRILMDEFLASGETHVRNLEMGIRRAEGLGRAMPIGYLPDMFGHVAQMPQLLRRAGIADAVVWRGVPAAIDRHAFTWAAPDGSTVRCEYLVGGYGNGRDVLALADRIGAKLELFVALQRAAFGDDELIAMYGEDHSIPRPGYADLVAAFNASQDRYEIRIETLTEALRSSAAQPPALSWTGELRSGARANLLMGVTSHRIEVKQAAARAERLLERVVEPLWALHGRAWPAALLDAAWARVVENSAHDSICACSADPTVAQVLVRYAEAEQIATGLVDRLLVDVGAEAARGSFVVLNPSPFPRSDVVALDVPMPVDGSPTREAVVDPSGEALPVQDDGVVHRIVREAELDAAEVVPYLRLRMHARELFGYQVNGYRLEAARDRDHRRELTVDVDLTPDPEELDVDELLDEVAAKTALDPGARWHVAIVARPRRRLLVRPTIPALGWSELRVRTASPDSTPTPKRVDQPVTAGERSLSNGLVEVAVADDGTLTIAAGRTVIEGVGRIVDGGDAGDSYNYAPPADDVVVERPVSVEVETRRAGPLVGELVVRRGYDWPSGLTDDLATRTAETVRTRVDTTVELRTAEPFVRIAVELENRCVDHRVRLHVLLPHGADRSYAEGQFAIVERGLEVEGGHGEVPLPTFPAHGFVVAGDVAVLLEHAVEYELVRRRGASSADELALTLVRATGLISRDENAYRAEPAGPVIAAPGGQAQGRRRVAFAVQPLLAGPGDPAILVSAERYRAPFRVGGGSRADGPVEPVSGAGLSVTGEAIVVSSLRRRAIDATEAIDPSEVLELRLVHEAGGVASAVVEGRFAAVRTVDLLGRPLETWRDAFGRLEVDLGGWEIRTVQLRAG